MKKLFVSLFFCLFLISCASKPAPRSSFKLENTVEIAIKRTPNTVLVSFTYHGDDWLFIRAVEVMNGAGDTKICKISNPHRSVSSGGRVCEVGVMAVAYSDEFLEWLGDSASARVICDYPQEFQPVKITREN